MSNFVEKTIGQVLQDTVTRFPLNEALVYPDLDLRQNYREFYESCKKAAKGFMALGIKKGDHVSVWTTNVPQWIYIQFGLAMVGGVLVTVNTNYKSHELEYIVKQSDSSTLVLIEEYKDTNFFNTVDEVVPDLNRFQPGKIEDSNLPYLKNIIYIGSRSRIPGMFSYEQMLSSGERISDRDLEERISTLHFQEVINFQYTSGTTGFPKGVMLSHYNVVNNARMVGEVMNMSEKDRLLIQVPLFHCFGCVMSTLNCVYYGSTMVVLEYFDALKALTAVEKEKCTAINGVPTMFIAILNHADFKKFDLHSLRTGIMAGAPCPVETMNQVRTLMHCTEIVIAFGQTECSPVMTMTRRDDPVELRVATVGRLLPGIEGKIIDPAAGKDMPPNVTGEIVTRGDCVMIGYYKMEEATKEAVDQDGWLHTGDLGAVDENGYFKVTGRIKDMIIRGGENIYPREVEEFLLKNPKIMDVQVVGIPDKKYGEQLLAVIKLKANETTSPDELQEFCTGKIARHKIPKYWEFVADFPMTASGKVQKYKLRDIYSAKYGS